MTDALDVVTLFPLAVAVFAAGGVVFWPLARRGGYWKGWRDAEHEDDRARWTEPPQLDVEDVGYQGRHRLSTASGSSAQRDRIRALRAPTGEFAAIVATSYRSGEVPLIGRPASALVRAHMAAVSHG